jgi:zinc protease
MSLVERRNRAPVSAAVPAAPQLQLERATLSNGLQVLLRQDQRLPVVAAEWYVRGAGPFYETPEEDALASLTASMLRLGTKHRSSEGFAQESSRLGVTLAAQAEGEDARLSHFCLSEHFSTVLALAVEMLREPAMDAEELVKLKSRSRQQLLQARANSSQLLAEHFHRLLFGLHPAGRVLPSIPAVDAVTLPQLTQWHTNHYAPERMLVMVSGDVAMPQILRELEHLTQGWSAAQRKIPALPASVATSGREALVVNRGSAVQVSLALGRIAIDRRDEDYISASLMNRILGGGSGGRLFMNLREEKGYSYGVYSRLRADSFAGPLYASGEMKADTAGDAMREILNEFQRLIEEPVSAEELQRNQRGIASAFALSFERPEAWMQYELTRLRYELSEDYWLRYPDRVSAVTAADIQRVANRCLQSGDLKLTAVGDGARLRTMMESFAPVRIVEAD